MVRKIAVAVTALALSSVLASMANQPEEVRGKQEMSVPLGVSAPQIVGDRHPLPVLTQGTSNLGSAASSMMPALDPIQAPYDAMSLFLQPQFSLVRPAEPEAKLRPEPQPAPVPCGEEKADPGYYLEVVVTAYSRRETGGNRTSTGRRTQEGRTVAVDPRVIPYGTRIWIPGYGDRIAEDCGGAIKGNRIDLFFESYRAACNFGRQRITIMVYRQRD